MKKVIEARKYIGIIEIEDLLRKSLCIPENARIEYDCFDTLDFRGLTFIYPIFKDNNVPN
jgi:hypothetical protein